jgi:hypothetical protein
MGKFLIVHPDELSQKWIDRLKDLGTDTLGIHSVGGGSAHEYLARMIDSQKNDEVKALFDIATENGLNIEYELHAASYLLPRELFDTHPEYFRVDVNGERTTNANFCVSNKEALDFVSNRAAELAEALYASSDKFYFWLDDGKDLHCHCEKCRELSSSDQQLILMNRILEELRKEDPEATLAYLAYYGTLTPPEKVKPADGIFLEYAPIDRDFHKPLADATDEKNAAQNKHLRALLDTFGKDGAKVLDYWLDNSLFSNWTKPPKVFTPDEAVIQADFAYYRALGFSDISTFACYLGADYIELHVEPDIVRFVKAYKDFLS